MRTHSAFFVGNPPDDLASERVSFCLLCKGVLSAMASIVRMFSFTGTITATKSSGSTSYATDSIGLLKYPYAARELITANAGAQSTSSALTPAGAELLFVQVQQGKAVHIELNPPNRAVDADTSSPVITGDVLFKVGTGWTVSLLEHELS